MPSKKQQTIFDHLRKQYGLSYNWQAEQLGLERSNFYYYRRHGCLSEQQREVFERAIRATGAALSNFSLPAILAEDKRKKS